MSRRNSTDSSVLRSQNLAELAGTTVRALRHYHKIGLLPEVPRDSNGYRRYDARDLIRVLRIRQLAASGMPLRKIADALEQDPQNQAELLEELDRDLVTQIEQLEAQRKLLADLRIRMKQPAWFAIAEQPAQTQQLDQDLWTLMTATGDVDESTIATMHDLFDSESFAELAAAWYPRFEQLETCSSVDEQHADELAMKIADFADTVLAATALAPATEELPVMALVEQMQADTLSPAQQQVWGRFLTIIETRWAQEPSVKDS